MDDPNRQILEAVATVLVPVLDEVVFVGGCVTGLLITDPAAGKGVRPTTDVDVITEVSSYGEYGADLSERLRAISASYRRQQRGFADLPMAVPRRLGNRRDAY